MAFLQEPEPPRGVATDVAQGVRRIVAANPSVMTYHGTNTYLIETDEGIVVIDPGPDDAAHIAAVLAAGQGRIRRILLSHTHSDHLGAVASLRAATGASVAAYRDSARPEFVPDIALDDGAVIDGLTALFTPGHAADHLCFARSDGVLFSADHVMSWSSSIVNPPGGNMRQYFNSLNRLLERDDRLFLPGHGPPLPEPRRLVRALLELRTGRERQIRKTLGETPKSTAEIVDVIYPPMDPPLLRAAERSVLAHLIKLEEEGAVSREGDRWRIA